MKMNALHAIKPVSDQPTVTKSVYGEGDNGHAWLNTRVSGHAEIICINSFTGWYRVIALEYL